MTTAQKISGVLTSTSQALGELGQALPDLPAQLLTPAPTADARRLVSGAPSAGPVLKPPVAASCGLMRATNGMCWGVRDLSRLSFDDANRAARAAKEDKFIWHGVRYIVKADVRSSGLAPEEQLAKSGITDDQYNRAYVPGMSERFFTRIAPDGYARLTNALNAYGNRDDGARNTLAEGKWRAPTWAGISPNARLDSWALYLGLPQSHGTFRISPHKPAGAAQPAAEYLSFTDHAMDDALVRYALKKLPSENAQMIVADDINGGPEGFRGNKSMGHFVLERRQDEHGHYVAYSYTWQLAPMAGLPVVGMFLRAAQVQTVEASDLAGVGHPFNIYGRVYYDPATGKRRDVQP